MRDSNYYAWEDKYVSPYSREATPEEVKLKIIEILNGQGLPCPHLTINVLDKSWSDVVGTDEGRSFCRRVKDEFYLVFNIPHQGYHQKHLFPLFIVVHEIAHMTITKGHHHTIAFGELVIHLMVKYKCFSSELYLNPDSGDWDEATWEEKLAEEMELITAPALKALRARR